MSTVAARSTRTSGLEVASGRIRTGRGNREARSNSVARAVHAENDRPAIVSLPEHQPVMITLAPTARESPGSGVPVEPPRGIPLDTMSPVFDCTTPEGLADAIPKAADGVRSGQLVVLPTDTLYGVGADAFSPSAVTALLGAKGRGRDVPPPVLIGDVATVDGLAMDVPDYARALMAAFWPGPLTLVLEAQPSLAWDLGETSGTVALRMPDDEVALTLLRATGPMAVSSANRTGNPASRTVLDAAAQLGSSVTYYLDGGPVRGGLASTIVDCTKDEPEILRLGALAQDEISAVVDPILELARQTAEQAVGAEEVETVESDPAESERGESNPDSSDPVVSVPDPADTVGPPTPADPADPAKELHQS